jgi:signal transduction histidine kinase
MSPPAGEGRGARPLPFATSTPNPGLVYLDVRRRVLHCLNEAARQLHREGVPFLPSDLAERPGFTETGAPLTADMLPLMAAYRAGEPVDRSYILRRERELPWRVTWSAAPVRSRRGEVKAVIGTVVRTRAEPSWLEIAELAHDLRTPLHTMGLLCSLFDELPQTDPQVRQIVDTLRSTADRAGQIARELLEACGGPVRHRDGAPSWFPLEPFLAGLANEEAVAARRKGLTLTSNLSAVRGWETFADRVRLGRILANLLVNAVRYTPSGEVAFRASWEEAAGSRVLVLAVSDTGPGISEEDRESIFQAFKRGRAGKDSDSSGSGLGLSVVDRLVSELGLTLEVFGQHGQGSEFRLVLPAAMLREASATV